MAARGSGTGPAVRLCAWRTWRPCGRPRATSDHAEAVKRGASTDADRLTAVTTQLGGTGIWNPQLRFGDAGEAAALAAELEGLGYSALWIPDTGGDVFTPLGNLLGAT